MGRMMGAAGLFVLVVFLASVDLPRVAAAGTLYDAVVSLPSSLIFVGLAKRVGLDAAWKKPNSAVTLLVPTDQAFLATLRRLNLNPAQVAMNPKLIAALVNYHTLPKPYSLSQLKEGVYIRTALSGRVVRSRVKGTKHRFTGAYGSSANVVTTIKVGKNYICRLDSVLIANGLLPKRLS